MNESLVEQMRSQFHFFQTWTREKDLMQCHMTFIRVLKLSLFSGCFKASCSCEDHDTNQGEKHRCWLCAKELTSDPLGRAHYLRRMTVVEPST